VTRVMGAHLQAREGQQTCKSRWGVGDEVLPPIRYLVPLPEVRGAGATDDSLETSVCSCLCAHETCASFRLGEWCRTWCVARWVLREKLSSDALQELVTTCLEGVELRFVAALRQGDDGLWEYQLLLHVVCPCGEGLDPAELLSLDVSGIDLEPGVRVDEWDEYGVELFKCCEHAVKRQMDSFAEAMMIEGAEYHGDLSLVHYLTEQVVTRTGKW